MHADTLNTLLEILFALNLAIYVVIVVACVLTRKES